jgi:hypothetical protein
MARPKKPTNEDVGAAMIAWYQASLETYPDGLVTQAQAATMLGIGRVAVSRLVTRGYLRAVYFPKPPDIVGIAVGHDDPMWLKITGWLGDFDQTYAFPKACYVSFGDVVELWKSGKAREKCKRDWNEIMANFLPKVERYKRMKEIHGEHYERAQKEREKNKNIT